MSYFDSSALAKRYIKENGSEAVKSILADASIVVTSKLAYPEILAAFRRKFNSGELSAASLKKAVNAFESDWENFFIIEFRNELLPIIKDMIEKHSLKGADSLHLSSFLWLKNETEEDLPFISSDVKLLKAAKSENLKVINPEG